MNAQDFITRLRKYFFRETPTPDFLATIRDYLDGRSEQYLRKLLELVINNCRWFPTQAELNELGKRIHIEVKRLPEPELTEKERKEGLGILADCLKGLGLKRVNQITRLGLGLETRPE